MNRVRDWWCFTVLAPLFITGTAEAVVAYKTGTHWFPLWAEVVYNFAALAVGGLAALVTLSWLHQAADDWQAGRRARVANHVANVSAGTRPRRTQDDPRSP